MNSREALSGWTLVDLPWVEQVKQSTELHELSRANWPSWARRSPQFSRILVFSELASLGTTMPSTSVVAALLTERIDPSDAPKDLNYNLYLVVESTSGEYWQSAPIRPTNPTHHSSAPSTWFENLGAPL